MCQSDTGASNVPESIGMRGAVPDRGGTGPRRVAGIISGSAERATGSKTSSTVATGRKHRLWSQGDVSTCGPAGRALQASQVVHTDLIASLLGVACREIASITTAGWCATTSTTLVVSSRLLGLCSLCSLSLNPMISTIFPNVLGVCSCLPLL